MYREKEKRKKNKLCVERGRGRRQRDAKRKSCPQFKGQSDQFSGLSRTAYLYAVDRVGERLCPSIYLALFGPDELDSVGVRGWVSRRQAGILPRARLSRDRDTTVPRWYLSRVFPSATFEELPRRRKCFIIDKNTKK